MTSRGAADAPLPRATSGSKSAAVLGALQPDNPNFVRDVCLVMLASIAGFAVLYVLSDVLIPFVSARPVVARERACLWRSLVC